MRVRPEIHDQLTQVATLFGLDANGLLNLMIRRSLGQLAAEANVYRRHFDAALDDRTLYRLKEPWEAAHPTRRRRDFLDEFRKYAVGEPSDVDGLEVGEEPAM